MLRRSPRQFETKTRPRTPHLQRAGIAVGFAAGASIVVLLGSAVNYDVNRQAAMLSNTTYIAESDESSRAHAFDRDVVFGGSAVKDLSDVRAKPQASSDDETDRAAQEMRYFNGRPICPVRTMTMTVTAYSPDARSCGDQADGITASGYSVWTNGMKLVAADTELLPFGSLLSIPGYDNDAVVPVLDRGGLIRGNRLDVLFPTHEQARQWGVREIEVIIWEYADGQPNDFKPRHVW